MAIAYGSAGTRFAASAATTSYSIPYPSGIAAGDLLILFMSINGGTGVTPPSGWTTIHNETTLPNPKGGLYYKIATGSESGSLAVTLGSAVTGNGIIFRYTGVDTTNPIDATGTLVRNTTAANSIALPAITTTSANTMLVLAGGVNGGTAVVSSTGGTERIDFNSPAVTGSKGGGLYDSAQAAIGASAPKTIAISQTLANWGIMVALREASTTPPPAYSASVALSGSGTLTLSASTSLSLAVTAPFSGGSSLTATGIAQMASINTNLNPKPYVLINDVEMPISFTQGDAVVLGNLSFTWGRKNQLDSVSPATLSLTILDRTGDWVKSQEIMGLNIAVGVRFTDSQGIYRDFKNFRGRIIDVEIVARDADMSTSNGYFVYIRAADKVAELGNYFISNTTWPAEGYEGRKPRMLAAVSNTISDIAGSYVSGQLQFSEKKIGQESVLDLLSEHLEAGVEWINYDPDTNRIETTGRVTFEGSTWQGLRLADDSAGKYGLETDVSEFYAPFPNHYYNVDAGGFEAKSGISRSIESGISEVLYEFSTDAAGNKSTWTIFTGGLGEAKYGKRALTVRTENRTNVSIFASNYAKAAIAAMTWQPPEFTWDTRRENRGFQNFIHVRNFIGGRVWHDPLFLSRNRYNSFPNKVPIYFVIGGTCTYSADDSGDMGWVVEPHFGNAEFFTGFTPLKWNTINPSSSPVLKWSDLNNTVTWNDISQTGQGV